MRVSIFTNDQQKSLELKKVFIDKLLKNNITIDDLKPELVIFIGGDGTFLRSVHHYLNKLNEVIFVGVCTGSLGFFYDYSMDDIDELIEDFLKNKLETKSYRLIEGEIVTDKKEIIYAINEIRLENPFHTLKSDVYIDDVCLETFRGNGLIVSSSLGSSAYNRSLSGAIIEPSLEVLELTEIATIRNKVFSSLGSSLVIKEDKKITFKGDFEKVIIGFDHLLFKSNSLIKEINIYLSNKTVRLAHLKRTNYFDLLKKSFL